MKQTVLIAVLFSFLAGISFSQSADTLKIKELEKRIKALEEKRQNEELEKLLKKAEETVNEKDKEEKKNKVFKSGQRSLQAINPEISVTGDAFAQYSENNINKVLRDGFIFRGLGLHFQSALDPFSVMKAAIGFSQFGVGLGEAYITWFDVLPRLSVTAGKFRQQFGVINRWHVHALDQIDFPLALTTILGPEGLNQIGISLDWFMPPLWADANSLTVQITNGQNAQLFSGDAFSFPAVLAHLKNYFDVSENAYVEIGFTGLYGKNSPEQNSAATKPTYLFGADFTFNWEPVNRAHYNMFELRSELYFAHKELAENKIEALGGYVYAQYKFNEFFTAGVRLDATQPFSVNNKDEYVYQISPYVTWEQSHWVKLRFQYNWLENNFENRIPAFENDTARLQVVFAVGPHKHDRY